ncbi:unnamed protein product [Amoebophrya sp. A25]|nr:unnamed protein product [Amoebophrya sp. A25]|eukprot:GSA25T00015770001.1
MSFSVSEEVTLVRKSPPTESDIAWGFASECGEWTALSSPVANQPLQEDIVSVKKYFSDLEAHLHECPENYADFASIDCLMVRPNGVYMRNAGLGSREEMCKTYLTWLAPQKLVGFDNIRFSGEKKDTCACQVRMYQKFQYGATSETTTLEEDVAVFTFALEKVPAEDVEKCLTSSCSSFAVLLLLHRFRDKQDLVARHTGAEVCWSSACSGRCTTQKIYDGSPGRPKGCRLLKLGHSIAE